MAKLFDIFCGLQVLPERNLRVEKTVGASLGLVDPTVLSQLQNKKA